MNGICAVMLAVGESERYGWKINLVPGMAVVGGVYAIKLGLDAYLKAKRNHQLRLTGVYDVARFAVTGSGAGLAFVVFGAAMAIVGVIYSTK